MVPIYFVWRRIIAIAHRRRVRKRLRLEGYAARRVRAKGRTLSIGTNKKKKTQKQYKQRGVDVLLQKRMGDGGEKTVFLKKSFLNTKQWHARLRCRK